MKERSIVLLWKSTERGTIEQMFENVEYKAADLLAEDAEALVNTVNCVGVMGKGLALQFKKKFRTNFDAYAKACEEGAVRPGRMFVVDLRQDPAFDAQAVLPMSFAEAPVSYQSAPRQRPRYIINFPTKDHWRNGSRMQYIDDGLADLVRQIRARGIRSVAIPALGCDLGGLAWDDVRPRIEAALGGLADVQVVVCEPRRVSRLTPLPTPFVAR